METESPTTKSISLKDYGIHHDRIHYQLSPDSLHAKTIAMEMGKQASSGALAVHTGEFTGRSPMDRFIVEDEITKDKIWWGDINIPFDAEKFDKLYNKVASYLNERDVFVRDSYACAADAFRLNIRVINEYPWSNMFVYNMFLRPTEEELKSFDPEWVVLNAPGFTADAKIDGTRQHNFAILNFTRKVAIVGGTGYTGEIKKGIFSALN
ncbi:MAG: phosphoenolpyruvate carboxykinase (ATP), partial [Bacteroidota bacterium]